MPILFSPQFLSFEVLSLIVCILYTVSYIIVRWSLFVVRYFEALYTRRRVRIETLSDQGSPSITVTYEEATKPAPADIETKSSSSTATISPEDRQRVIELIKLSTIRVSRGEIQDAKSAIVEGLSIDKFNKELNCLLASLYENEKDYKRAEIVYKDLIILHPMDTELYLKLGFVIVIQSKYEIAYEIYKKLHDLDPHNTEAMNMLAHITHEIWAYAESEKYANEFLNKNPRNVDILLIQVSNQIELQKREAALETINKILVIEPYNEKIKGLKEKLRIESEMAEHFETEK